MKVVLEESPIQQETTNEPCKEGDQYTHRFPDDFKIHDFCDCCKWQIIKIISSDVILCIDINGKVSEFDRKR